MTVSIFIYDCTKPFYFCIHPKLVLPVQMTGGQGLYFRLCNSSTTSAAQVISHIELDSVYFGLSKACSKVKTPIDRQDKIVCPRQQR